MILQLVVRSHRFQRRNEVIILWAFWLKEQAFIPGEPGTTACWVQAQTLVLPPTRPYFGCWALGLQLVHSALALGGVWHQIGCSDAFRVEVALLWGLPTTLPSIPASPG